jgi:hypothetical protein
MSSTTTNYKVNLVDLSNVLIPLNNSNYSLISSSSGLPNQLFYYTCAISGNGAIMITGATPLIGTSPLYISFNYGVTWSTASGVSNSVWRCISCSPSGQYIAAGTQSGSIWASSNSGSTWTLLTALPTNPTSGVPVNYGNPSYIVSLSINNSGLLLVSATYSGASLGTRQLLFYSNNLSFWYLQQFQGYSNTPLYIQSCKISNSSTSIFSPEFMCCVTQYFSGMVGGIWVYTSGNPVWTNYGSTVTQYQSIDISNDGKYGVVGLNNSVSSSLYLSSNYGQTWTLSNSPTTNVISNTVCMNSTGSMICYNNFIISYNYGYSWNTLPSIPYSPTWVSLTYNSLTAFLVSISSATVTTGCYIYNLRPINQPTKYLVNGTDLSSLFKPQLIDPSNSYYVTNYRVSNFVPCWSNIQGTYDLGQVFFYLFSGIGYTYIYDSINARYVITFNNSGYIYFYDTSYSNINYIAVGGGGGGGIVNNPLSFWGNGGGGGSGGKVLQSTFISPINTKLLVNIGNGGLPTVNGTSTTIIYNLTTLVNAIGGNAGSTSTGGANVNVGGAGGGNGGTINSSDQEQTSPTNGANGVSTLFGTFGGCGGGGADININGAPPGGLGGTGGGGLGGGGDPNNPASIGTSGTPNTGGGGGGNQFSNTGNSGGSGTVILYFSYP